MSLKENPPSEWPDVKLEIKTPEEIYELQDPTQARPNPSIVGDEIIARIESNIGSRMLPEVKINSNLP